MSAAVTRQSAADLAAEYRALMIRIVTQAEKLAAQARAELGEDAPPAEPPPPMAAIEADLTAAVHRAIHAPQLLLPRLGGGSDLEPLPQWQTRAVLVAIAPYLPGGAR